MVSPDFRAQQLEAAPPVVLQRARMVETAGIHGDPCRLPVPGLGERAREEITPQAVADELFRQAEVAQIHDAVVEFFQFEVARR